MRRFLLAIPVATIMLCVVPTIAMADVTLEAESMTLGANMEVRTGPPVHVAMLSNSGTTSTSGLRGTFTGATTQLKFTVWAKNPPLCLGDYPRLRVLVDGSQVTPAGDVAITSTSTTNVVTQNVNITGTGSHTINLQFNNDAGDGTCDRNIYVDKTVVVQTAGDTTPPDTTITNGPANPTTATTADFSFTGTDNVGVTGFDCRLDGAAYAACTSPKSYTGLAVGSHTFDVRAKDAAGNVDATPASQTWTINSPPPPPTGRDFPRLGSTHYGITSTADAQSLAKWDWVVVDGENPSAITSYWPVLRSTNPNIKILAYIDGAENNNRQTDTRTCISPNQYDDPNLPASLEWTDNWWLKNYNGTYPNMPGQTGRHMANPTSYVPANAGGERWNEHLAAWVDRCYRAGAAADGVMLDMVNDTSLWNSAWPNWDLTVKAGSNMDLDRNTVRDVTEHGTDWVNDTWGAGMRDQVHKIRTAVGSTFIVMSNSGNGTTFAPDANGQSYEHGSSPSNGVFNDSLVGMMQQWDTNHFGTQYTAMQSQAGSTGAQTNYKFMRHNLAATLMTNAYFTHGCGAPCNYNTNWWYDEYSVNTTTGAATGDASRKGYLGQPTGAATHLGNGLWRRDFDNGIVLANNTGSSITYSLGGTFRRINGTQDHTVNNGASGVTSVTLAAQDGLLLLR